MKQNDRYDKLEVNSNCLQVSFNITNSDPPVHGPSGTENIRFQEFSPSYVGMASNTNKHHQYQVKQKATFSIDSFEKPYFPPITEVNEFEETSEIKFMKSSQAKEDFKTILTDEHSEEDSQQLNKKYLEMASGESSFVCKSSSNSASSIKQDYYQIKKPQDNICEIGNNVNLNGCQFQKTDAQVRQDHDVKGFPQIMEQPTDCNPSTLNSSKQSFCGSNNDGKIQKTELKNDYCQISLQNNQKENHVPNQQDFQNAQQLQKAKSKKNFQESKLKFQNISLQFYQEFKPSKIKINSNTNTVNNSTISPALIRQNAPNPTPIPVEEFQNNATMKTTDNFQHQFSSQLQQSFSCLNNTQQESQFPYFNNRGVFNKTVKYPQQQISSTILQSSRIVATQSFQQTTNADLQINVNFNPPQDSFNKTIGDKNTKSSSNLLNKGEYYNHDKLMKDFNSLTTSYQNLLPHNQINNGAKSISQQTLNSFKKSASQTFIQGTQSDQQKDLMFRDSNQSSSQKSSVYDSLIESSNQNAFSSQKSSVHENLYHFNSCSSNRADNRGTSERPKTTNISKSSIQKNALHTLLTFSPNTNNTKNLTYTSILNVPLSQYIEKSLSSSVGLAIDDTREQKQQYQQQQPIAQNIEQLEQQTWIHLKPEEKSKLWFKKQEIQTIEVQKRFLDQEMNKYSFKPSLNPNIFSIPQIDSQNQEYQQYVLNPRNKSREKAFEGQKQVRESEKGENQQTQYKSDELYITSKTLQSNSYREQNMLQKILNSPQNQ